MSRRYEGGGFPVSAIFIAILVIAVVGLLFAYMDVSGKVAQAQFDSKRAALLVDRLETQLNTFDSKVQTTEERARSSAKEAATQQAKETTSSVLAVELAKYRRLDALQTGQAGQVMELFPGRGSFGVGSIDGDTFALWRDGNGQLRNRISGGTVNFGDKVILSRPGEWNLVKPVLGEGFCTLCVASDQTTANYDTPVVVIRDHENTQGILLLGQEGSGATRNEWRMALYTDKLMFGPPGGRQERTGLRTTDGFDVGISRDPLGNLRLMSGGNPSVTVTGDGFIVEGGKVVLGSIKNDAGDPPGQDGQIYINTADNAIKMYAEGAWRTLTKW
ncbi:MAG: hypothetical protein Q7K03_04010 [Dehalococcoidia bacterium]|nr:hypothetical protein [Dehalococcoidia bacterium]